jgi:predicted PurR-regulated permease PerM
MVNVVGVPGQEVAPLVLYGVTVMVPVIGAVPVFVPVKLIADVPEATSPMAVLLLVQV